MANKIIYPCVVVLHNPDTAHQKNESVVLMFAVYKPFWSVGIPPIHVFRRHHQYQISASQHEIPGLLQNSLY
jgi:hypothetical protein